MKVLMISDASNVEAADAAVLGEVRRALETEAHDVDIVRVNPGLADDLAAKALALLGNADVVVFGNGDQGTRQARASSRSFSCFRTASTPSAMPFKPLTTS